MFGHAQALVALEEVGLHYCEWGDSGPDVLIIHGIMGIGVRWDLFARSLMDDFQVIAPTCAAMARALAPRPTRSKTTPATWSN